MGSIAVTMDHKRLERELLSIDPVLVKRVTISLEIEIFSVRSHATKLLRIPTTGSHTVRTKINRGESLCFSFGVE